MEENDELKERLWLGRDQTKIKPAIKGRLRTVDYGLWTADCGLRTADCGLLTGYKIVRIDTANIKSCFISAKHLDF